MIKSYLKYLRNRVNAQGLHDPFLLSFYHEVLKKAPKVNLTEVENLRRKLKKDETILDIVDLGAGSRTTANNTRKVKSLAKNVATSRKYGSLLWQIAKVYNCNNVLEFGTSLGLGTAYLAKASDEVNVITMEGSPAVMTKAKSNFKELRIENVIPLQGDFDDLLTKPEVNQKQYDLIFIDGNHRKNATLRYVEFALEHTHENSFIILDDIYWSAEMKEAWELIKQNEHIHVSIDLFKMGIVCKRKTQQKHHVVVKF